MGLAHGSLVVAVLGTVLSMGIVSGADAAEVAVDPVQAAIRALAGVGAVAYSHRPNYSEAIDDLFVGYDASGRPIAGAALREFKTYERVTAMTVVQAVDGAFVIHSAEIPDIGIIRNPEKQRKVTDAIISVTGRTVRDASGKSITVDAVTGATRYQKRIYTSFNLMARAIVTEIRRNPADWEKKQVPPAGQ